MTFLLIACGGDNGDNGDNKQDATLTANNAPQAAGAVVQVIYLTELVDLIEGISGFFISNTSNSSNLNTSDKSQPKGFLYRAINKGVTISTNKILNDGQFRSSGTIPQTSESCPGGGTVTLSATWTGPDNPTHPSQIIDLNATITFSSCGEGTMTMNGTVNIVLSGPANNPTSLAFSSSNFNFSDSATGDNIAMTNFSLESTDTTITVSGAISGTADGHSINEEYENITIVVSSTTGGETITISGRMKPSCLDGWITIGTNTAIFVPTDADCPTAGEVVITSAGNTVKVVIESDSTINVYFNDVLETTYSSCSELEGVCST
jgi:hypothetical protein